MSKSVLLCYYIRNVWPWGEKQPRFHPKLYRPTVSELDQTVCCNTASKWRWKESKRWVCVHCVDRITSQPLSMSSSSSSNTVMTVKHSHFPHFIPIWSRQRRMANGGCMQSTDAFLIVTDSRACCSNGRCYLDTADRECLFCAICDRQRLLSISDVVTQGIARLKHMIRCFNKCCCESFVPM